MARCEFGCSAATCRRSEERLTDTGVTLAQEDQALDRSAGVTDAFQQRLDALERIRSEIARRQRVTFFAFLPLSIAMALIIPYMQIVITLQDADYYYILERPDWGTYLRLASPALFAGPIAAGIVVLAFRQFDDLMPTVGRMAILGAAYGFIMPFLTGLFTPLNLFVIGITGVSNVSGQGSVQQMIGDWVFSTPMFTFLFWIDWLGPSIAFGLVAGLIFWAVARLMGPVENAARAKWIFAGSAFASAVILVLVMVWPFGLFSFMFETFL